MQIHELTKRKRTDEGLLDGVKAAISSVAKSGMSGLSNDNIAVAKNQNALNQANQGLADLNAKYGWDIKSPTRTASQAQAQAPTFDQVITQTKQDPKVQQDIAKLEPQFSQVFMQTEFDPTQPDDLKYLGELPFVQQGKKFVLPVNTTGDKGPAVNYELNDKGVWSLDGRPVTAQRSIAMLNRIAAIGGKGFAGQGREVSANNLSPQPPGKGRKSKMAEAVQPASGGKDLQTSFNRWVSGRVPNYVKATKDPDVKAKLDAAFQKLVAAKKDPKAAEAAFKEFMTVAFAGVRYIADKAQIAQGGKGRGRTKVRPTTPAGQQLAQELDTVGTDALSSLRGQKIKNTGNPALNDLLKSAGAVLSESQVVITKDIHVETNAGTYTKKAEDQQWYDPNGVLIDPVKYADYIKKLDATPAAQTRYQADQGKGSADAIMKNRLNPVRAKKSEPVKTLSPAELQAAHIKNLNQQTDAAYDAAQIGNILDIGDQNQGYLTNRLYRQMAKK